MLYNPFACLEVKQKVDSGDLSASVYSAGCDENKQGSDVLFLNSGVGVYNEIMWAQVQPFRKWSSFFKANVPQTFNSFMMDEMETKPLDWLVEFSCIPV